MIEQTEGLIMNQTTKAMTFTVPLSFEAHSIAQHCRQGQFLPRKAKQVYLNTLAVYAVDFYLRCLGFETDWNQSDSRNPLMLKFMDVADLEVKQLGKLECRPVLPGAEVCEIPPEVWEDRIGYLAVQLNQSLKEAKILGFTQTAAAEVPIRQLQSLEELLVYLSQIRQRSPVDLRQWFEGIIEAGWLAIEELITPQQVELAFSFRNAVNITRGKKIDLGMQLGGESVVLLVTLPPEADEEVDIVVQVYPMGQMYLPPGVQLIVSDESENQREAQSREADNLIQLEFSAESGERFNVTVALEEARVTQEFVI